MITSEATVDKVSAFGESSKEGKATRIIIEAINHTINSIRNLKGVINSAPQFNYLN